MRPTLALAALAAGVAAAPALTTSASARACVVPTETRDAWVRVNPPPGALPVSVAESYGDPCLLLLATGATTAYVTRDGGATWRGLSFAKPVTRVFGEGLPRGLLVAAYAAGGYAVSRDGGVTFHDGDVVAVAGPVVAMTGDPADERVVYAVADTSSTAGAPSLYRSADGGESFVPEPGSAGIRATAVAVDPAVRDSVWINDSAAAGVWHSADGGTTFAPSRAPIAEPVTDVAVGAVPDGPSVVAAATAHGVQLSRDGGEAWQPGRTGVGAAYGIRFEEMTADALMAVGGDGGWRSVDGGERFRRTTGLPAGCAPRRLVRSDTRPSAFLAVCPGDGVFRYVSSGADLVGGRRSGPNGPRGALGPDAEVPPPKQLPVLARRHVPWSYQASGSVAFDGAVLYFGPAPAGSYHGEATTYVQRVVAATGRALPELAIPVGVANMSYDARRHRLYLQAIGDGYDARMYSYDLLTHRLRAMFRLPWPQGRVSLYSYDATTDRFVVGVESSDVVQQVDLTGRVRSECTVRRGAGASNQGPYASGSQATAMVAAGYGGAGYWQAEDDWTMLHLGPRCEVLAVYAHRRFAESDENDGLVCDTVTFGMPAIWIRDSDNGDVYAYGVPAAYCPLATGLSVTVAPVVADATPAPVCARVTLRGGTAPLPGETVQFTVAGHGLGSAVTGADGRACVPYRAAIADVPAARGTPGRVPVRAAFLGTRSYLPSAAATALRVVAPAVLVVPPPPAPVVAQVAANVAPAEPPAPVAHGQVEPLPQPHPQAQPNPQPHPHGAAGAVPEAEDELQVAEQTEDTAPAGYGAAALMAGATAYAVRRRTQRGAARAGR